MLPPDLLPALLNSVPSALQQSLWKACGHVLGVGAGWPAAYLRGKAELTRAKFDEEVSQIDARTRAREIVELAGARAAAAQFADPAKAERAFQYHTAQQYREQENREEVLRIAAEKVLGEIPTAETEGAAPAAIDDDWTAAFFKVAATRSSEDFRELFGRVLAGEIRKPGTFSIGAVQSLARITRQTADLFQTACNVSLAIAGLVKIVQDPIGQATENGLLDFGLSFLSLQRLVEEGLLRSDLSERLRLPAVVYTQQHPFELGGQTFWMRGSVLADAPELPLSGPSFTQAGIELRSIVSMELSESYVAKLAEWLKPRSIELIRATGRLGAALTGTLVETARAP